MRPDPSSATCCRWEARPPQRCVNHNTNRPAYRWEWCRLRRKASASDQIGAGKSFWGCSLVCCTWRFLFRCQNSKVWRTSSVNTLVWPPVDSAAASISAVGGGKSKLPSRWDTADPGMRTGRDGPVWRRGAVIDHNGRGGRQPNNQTTHDPPWCLVGDWWRVRAANAALFLVTGSTPQFCPLPFYLQDCPLGLSFKWNLPEQWRRNRSLLREVNWLYAYAVRWRSHLSHPSALKVRQPQCKQTGAARRFLHLNRAENYRITAWRWWARRGRLKSGSPAPP